MNQVTRISKSHRLFERAKHVIPGGVNSPVRALRAVDTDPIFMDHADGAHLFDTDGNSYIDYIGSWGPMILGHRHPAVLEALENVIRTGISFGAPCQGEVQLAEMICQIVDSIEMVRMVNSGTEATMSAIRLARAYTKKSIVVKFDGCYHGHGDSFLIKAGSGLATLGISSSAGVPEEIAKLTISLPYNDLDSVKKCLNDNKDIAAIIVEPIVGNAGLILPQPGFLEGLKEACTAAGALLIFDEVMTGFRVARGGAQDLYKIKADLTCLGKIIGGGLPVGAYGGRRDIMEMVAPLGDVYQAGTLSGNPLAMAAGLAQLKSLQWPQAYESLERKTKQLADGLSELSTKKLPMQVVHTTGMLGVFFTKQEVTDFATAQSSDTAMFSKVWRSLSDKGIYWPPSQFESAFISLVHSKQDIEDTIKAFEETLAKLA
jgi:glutamate-1-semialdehyde 2,1-aminomutase